MAGGGARPGSICTKCLFGGSGVLALMGTLSAACVAEGPQSGGLKVDPREPPRRQGAFCGLALTLCRARDQGGAALRGHSSFCKEPNPCPSTEEEVASAQGTASSTDPQTLHARGWAGLHVALWGQSQAWGTGTWGRGNRLLRKGYQGSHSTGPSISCAKPTQGSGSSFLPAFQLWDEMLQPLSLSFTSGQNTPVTCIVVQIGCQLCADRGPGPE